MITELPPDSTFTDILKALQAKLIPLGPWTEGHISIDGMLPPWAKVPALVVCPIVEDDKRDSGSYSVSVWLYEGLPGVAPKEDNLLGRTDESEGLLLIAAKARRGILTFAPVAGVEDVEIGPATYGAGILGEESNEDFVTYATFNITYDFFLG
jgi:hypothetical protein